MKTVQNNKRMLTHLVLEVRPRAENRQKRDEVLPIGQVAVEHCGHPPAGRQVLVIVGQLGANPPGSGNHRHAAVLHLYE